MVVTSHSISTGCQFLYKLDNDNNNGMTTLALTFQLVITTI